MDKRVTGIIAYLTIIGWIVAYIAGDKEGAKFHLNQGLVIVIFTIINCIIGYIPLIGWILSWIIRIFLLVCMIIGIIGAAQDQEKEIPLLGSIKLLK